MNRNAALLVGTFALAVALAPSAHGDDPALPDDAKKVLAELEKKVQAIEAKARKAVTASHEESVKALQDIHDAFAKGGKKDEAAAVAGAIKLLKEEHFVLSNDGKVLNDPGSLTGYRGKNDEVFYVRVTGTTDGQVWGTGVYTDDSSLAAAAVHAGVLKKGETGIVKVTIQGGEASYTGSAANDVTSEGWDQWDGSFKVEAVKAEKK